jgi:signal transduction histidine kinase
MEQAPLIAAFAHELASALSGARYALGSVLGENDDRISLTSDQNALRDALLALRASLDSGVSIVNQAREYAHLGRLVPGRERVHVGTLFARLHSELKANLAQGSTELHVVAPADLVLAVNEVHLYAIFRNLVANASHAIANAPEPAGGKIVVTITTANNRIDIKVEDNGPGVPEALRTKIFRPFFTTKGHEGTGIGLGFCRQIAALYGGSITLAHTQRGATFTIVLYGQSHE